MNRHRLLHPGARYLIYVILTLLRRNFLAVVRKRLGAIDLAFFEGRKENKKDECLRNMEEKQNTKLVQDFHTTFTRCVIQQTMLISLAQLCPLCTLISDIYIAVTKKTLKFYEI